MTSCLMVRHSVEIDADGGGDGVAKMTLGELLEQSGTLDDDYGNGYYNLDIRDECEEFTWIQGTSHSRLIWLLGDIPVESFEPADKNTLIVWVNSEYITEKLKRRDGDG